MAHDFSFAAEHDWRLAMIALALSFAAAWRAFSLIGRLPATISGQRKSDLRLRGLMLLSAGALTALTMWAGQYIAILAYDPDFSVRYNTPFSLLSLAVTFLATTASFAVGQRKTKPGLFAAGLMFGAAMGLTQLLSSATVIVDNSILWIANPTGAAVSVTLAVAALFINQRLQGRRYALAACATLMMLAAAVAPLVYAPTTIAIDARLLLASGIGVDRITFAMTVGAVCVLLVMAGSALDIIERFTIARSMSAIAALVIVTMASSIAAGLYTFNQVRIGSISFDRIIANKDVVADVLPPPAYIIEAYLEVRIAIADPEKIEAHEARLKVLRREYDARHTFWWSSKLISGDVRQLLTVDSDVHVQAFWHELEDRFFPALKAGRNADVQASLRVLDGHYHAHRAIVEQIVAYASQNAADVSQSIAARGTSLEKLMGGSVALMIIIVLGSLWSLRTLVIAPVLEMAEYLDRLRHGQLQRAAPFSRRRDEVGLMGKAIETLRQDAIEKRRLETEATDARNARDRERAAEAFRLSAANEHITGLNSELTQTIDQLERARDENLRKGRLAQLGQLTATVAHEIRNPLGAIKGAATLIDRKLKGQDLGIDGPLQRISNGIQRCDAIISELLDFTRIKTFAPAAQPLDAWLADVIEEERANIPSTVAIDLDANTGDQALLFDRNTLRRVLINLLSNAAEAMVGKAGTPHDNPTENPSIRVTTRIIGGNVEIIVLDNGPGITPENLKRIRDPLFTTKSFGIGLGIPAIENILEQHGGGLRIVSAQGQGAMMTAWFPKRVENEVAEPSATRETA